jgi:hypothetical protein
MKIKMQKNYKILSMDWFWTHIIKIIGYNFNGSLKTSNGPISFFMIFKSQSHRLFYNQSTKEVTMSYVYVFAPYKNFSLLA